VTLWILRCSTSCFNFYFYFYFYFFLLLLFLFYFWIFIIMSQQIKKQITYVAPAQTAKALILVYVPLTALLILLDALVAYMQNERLDPHEIFAEVLIRLVAACAVLYLACHIYNWMAERFGGIEIHLDDVPEDKDKDKDE